MTISRARRTAPRVLTLAILLLTAVPLAAVGPAPAAQQDKDEAGGFALKTPSGGLEVSRKVNASRIGLPVYPGAQALAGDDRGDLAFNLSRRGKPDTKLLVAKFETADSPAQVRDYYKDKLGSRVTKFTVDSSDGSMSFEMKPDNRHGKYVQIKTAAGKTEIDLVRIEGMDLSDSSK